MTETTSPGAARRAIAAAGGPGIARWRRSAGIWLATGVLFAISAAFEPGSLGASALASLWPFAALLILAAVGQTLVVQQRGIDLSVPGFVSATVVTAPPIPNGNSGKPAPPLLPPHAAPLPSAL